MGPAIVTVLCHVARGWSWQLTAEDEDEEEAEERRRKEEKMTL